MTDTGIPDEELEKLLNRPYKTEARFIAPVALKNLRFVNTVIKSIKEETKEDLKGLRKDLQRTVNRAFILIIYFTRGCQFTVKAITVP